MIIVDKQNAEYFYSLCHKRHDLVASSGGAKLPRSKDKKKRHCLKCQIVFTSSDFGNRVCGACAAQNNRASKLAPFASHDRFQARSNKDAYESLPQ